MSRGPYTYQLGPITITSDMILPFSPTNSARSDLCIATTDNLPEISASARTIQSAAWVDDQLWILVGARPVAWIHEGVTINILSDYCRLSPEGTKSVVCDLDFKYLLSLCTAVALMQRGMLLLHASATAQSSEARVYLGQSGAGKSTAALFDAMGGALVLSDDVVPVYLDDAGVARTFQFDPVSALLREPDPAVAWMYNVLPKDLYTRQDGKLLYRASPIDTTATFAIGELVCLDSDAPHVDEVSRVPLLTYLLRNLASAPVTRATLGQGHLQLAAIVVRQARHCSWIRAAVHETDASLVQAAKCGI